MMKTTETRNDRSLGVVIQETQGHMGRLGYSRGYRRHFDRTWRAPRGTD
jgi:hypothetical protein